MSRTHGEPPVPPDAAPGRGVPAPGAPDGRPIRWLVITAVDAEADAVRRGLDAAVRALDPTEPTGATGAAPTDGPPRAPVDVVVGGVGRTNAAVATVEAVRAAAIAPTLVVSAGIAGRLPGGPDDHPGSLPIGAGLVATHSVYHEEGIVTPDGFSDLSALGFPLGDFDGNAVPGDPSVLAHLAGAAPDLIQGRIATVATGSGTDAHARDVTERTRSIAEAMEGAAVVHAARRLGVPAIEVRSISNTTGDRTSQRWDLPRAFAGLETTIATVWTALAAARPSSSGA